jgi:hypothetical protein
VKSPYLDDFKIVLEQWVDQRFLSRDDLLALWMLSEYAVNVLDSVNASYRGFTFREDIPLSLLVVKMRTDEGGFVCFVNGRGLAECAKVFFTKLEEDRVEWRVDQFAK